MNKHVELPISVDELHEIESLAVEIANLAGAEIKSALGGIFTVRYKTGATDSKLWKDPVSEVDRKVEKLIRERLAEQFPSHDIIGEESKERPRPDSDFIWAVDPIDGTTNFINGFPMFAASIGVLYRCKPIVGAVWCATSHALRAGVYHARIGGKLRFEGSDVTPKANPDVRSRLAGVPVAKAEDLPWETRKTGSAAIECRAGGRRHASGRALLQPEHLGRRGRSRAGSGRGRRDLGEAQGRLAANGALHGGQESRTMKAPTCATGAARS